MGNGTKRGSRVHFGTDLVTDFVTHTHEHVHPCTQLHVSSVWLQGTTFGSLSSESPSAQHIPSLNSHGALGATSQGTHRLLSSGFLVITL